MKTYTNPQFPGKVFRRLEVGEKITRGDRVDDGFTGVPWAIYIGEDDILEGREGRIFYREIPTHVLSKPTPSMDPDYIPNLAAELGIKTLIGQKALKLALENVQLLDRKQQDYGSQNIARHGEFGVLVRCDDKTARIANLLKQQPKLDLTDDPSEQAGPDKAQNESRLDSWLDMANYGLIGALVLKGEWH